MSERCVKGVSELIVCKDYGTVENWWNLDPHEVYVDDSAMTVRFSIDHGDTWQTESLHCAGLVFGCHKCDIMGV